MKRHHCYLLHITVAATRAKELWVCPKQRHHRRAEPLISLLDGALDLPPLIAVEPANQKSNWDQLRKPIHRRRGNIFHIRGLISCPKLGQSMPGFFVIEISVILFPSTLILPLFT
jgi:hypothetical protein